MIYISHRGNTNGPNIELENTKYIIDKCLDMNLDIEIDIWYYNNKLYLGHDHPKEEIDINFLQNNKLWCHAKNYEALFIMSQYNIHYFWHEDDDYTITSRGIIWAYPGMMLNNKSICVKPEISNYTDNQLLIPLGICSDYILNYI